MMTRLSMKKRMKTISARLSDEDLRWLDQLCTYYNITISEAVRMLLKYYVEQNRAKLMDKRDLEAIRFYEHFKQSSSQSRERAKERKL